MNLLAEILYFDFSAKILSFTTKVSHQLLRKIYDKLPASREQYASDALKVVISVVFHSVNQLCVCMKDQALSAISDSTKRVQEILTKFLEKNYGSTTVSIFDSPKEIVVCCTKCVFRVITL